MDALTFDEADLAPALGVSSWADALNLEPKTAVTEAIDNLDNVWADYSAISGRLDEVALGRDRTPEEEASYEAADAAVNQAENGLIHAAAFSTRDVALKAITLLTHPCTVGVINLELGDILAADMKRASARSLSSSAFAELVRQYEGAVDEARAASVEPQNHDPAILAAHRIFRHVAQDPGELQGIADTFADFYGVTAVHYCQDPARGGPVEMHDAVAGLIYSVEMVAHHWERHRQAMADVDGAAWRQASAIYQRALVDLRETGDRADHAEAQALASHPMPAILGKELVWSEDEITNDKTLSFQEKLDQITAFRAWNPAFEAKRQELKADALCKTHNDAWSAANRAERVLLKTAAPTSEALALKLDVLLAEPFARLEPAKLADMLTSLSSSTFGMGHVFQDALRLAGHASDERIAVKPFDADAWIDEITSRREGIWIDPHNGCPEYYDPAFSLSRGPTFPADLKEAFRALTKVQREVVTYAMCERPSIRQIVHALCRIKPLPKDDQLREQEVQWVQEACKLSPEEFAIVKADLDKFGGGHPTLVHPTDNCPEELAEARAREAAAKAAG